MKRFCALTHGCHRSFQRHCYCVWSTKVHIPSWLFMLTKARATWGQHSAQELMAASKAGFISYEMWSEEWWSDAWGDGCGDSAIFSWLLLPLIVARFACLHACVCVSLFFFLTLLCNAVSDLGKNMCQRDRERAEWMCDHYNLCVILDCTTGYLTSHRAALTRTLNIINSAYSVPYI